MNISAVLDGFPTIISAESMVGIGVVLTTLAAHVLRPKVEPGEAASPLLKAALLAALLLTIAPLFSQIAASGDLQVFDHPGYRHFVKFLVVAGCWASLLRTKADRALILNTLLASYALLAVIGLYRFLVLQEVNPDTGRMELLFRHGDPNFLCVYMGTGTTLALWRLVEARRTAADWALSVVAPLSIPAFLAMAWFTASRSGIFAIVVILGVVAVFLPNVSVRARALRVAGVLAALFAAFASDGERILQRFQLNDASTMGRISSLEAGWLGLTRNPFLGLGFKKSAPLMSEVGASAKFVTVDGGLTIHNTYLQIGAELGFVGLAVYAFCLMLLARAIAREYRSGARRTGFLLTVWAVATFAVMSALPMAYDVTLLGTMLLVFAVMPTPQPRPSARS